MQKITLEQSQVILADALALFAKWCEANGLRCFLAYGTLLGTMRNAGFIPWDDDVDVWMVREDLERMKSLEPPSGLRVLFPEDTGHTWFFTKVCVTHTNFVESNIDLNFPYGVYIDVFPLDKIPVRFGKLHFEIVQHLANAHRRAYVYTNPPKRKGLKRLINPLMTRITRLIGASSYQKAIDKCINCVNEKSDSDTVACFFTPYSYECETQGLEALLASEYAVFCGNEFMVPRNPQAHLAKLYGRDWNIPIRRHNPNHGTAFLDDGWTVETICSMLRNSAGILANEE